ncbi:MAG: V-type ATPase subunit [Actinobacteria bacterium]|nr:V-type ATPase subunit [Actinomycetota bacterium]MBU1943332.1 V-type ATPase subunit [Actinomycetota bacterium]MBU2686550.1 V-type ATPase subunit [Actinomycetota bacterium]
MKRSLTLFSQGSTYGHAVGRIMVHEAGLLNMQQVYRMIESDYAEALAVASETVYGPYLEGAATQVEVEEGLMRFLANQYQFIDRVTQGTPVSEFLHLKYDFHNLKVVLRRKYFGGTEGEELLSGLGSVTVDSIEGLLEGEGRVEVPGYVREAAERVSEAMEQGEPDPQRIDTIVDRAFLEQRLAVAEETGSELLVDFCRASIDLANILILVRGRKLDKGPEYYEEALAEGGELKRQRLFKLEGETVEAVAAAMPGSRYARMLAGMLEYGDEATRLTSFDRASDEFLLEELRKFSTVSVGPERVVRYMLARENEVAMLRVIFVGKLNALTPEVIESRLPVTYMREATR